jgi:hypothetical protein
MISSRKEEANPNCAETFASLRLFGDGLVPDEVSRRLGLRPTDCAAKGSETVAPSGKSRTAPTGRWILKSEAQVHSTDLARHIEWLLDHLDATGIVPLEIPGVSRADVLCFWLSATGHGGPEFSPELLGRLAKYRLALGLDIYFP